MSRSNLDGTRVEAISTHGFMYQAQCVHRCMATGLKEFSQHTRAESMQVCQIVDEINMQCAQDRF